MDVKQNNMKIDSKIISAFPGTGKTHYCNFDRSQYDPTPYGYCIDSDSSKFDKSNFPANYIEHIKSKIGKHPLIFVSSHKQVRDALVLEGLPFNLVYPDITLRSEYLDRYRQRGSSGQFIDLIDRNWTNWISELEQQTGCDHVVLMSGQYISNIM